jgi:hypothetical protein
MMLHRRDRLQAAFLRRHNQGRHGDTRQHGVEVHVDTCGGGAVGGACARLAHQLVGPPTHLCIRRTAAEPRALGVRRPLPYPLGADGIGIAAAAAAEWRAEQTERAEAMGVAGGELHAGRTPILGADQVAPLDGQRVEKASDVDGEFGRAPAVAGRLSRGAETRKIGPHDPVLAGEMRHPLRPRPRGFRIAVDHHHRLRCRPWRPEPVALIGHPHARPDFNLLHLLLRGGRLSSAHPAVLL